ncbi:MAG: hypothetical protein M8353_12060, partial [ANME-2 cluster archaeon]|nr:hypothetical protein [ANME-2 cluster archaeon]
AMKAIPRAFSTDPTVYKRNAMCQVDRLDILRASHAAGRLVVCVSHECMYFRCAFTGISYRKGTEECAMCVTHA